MTARYFTPEHLWIEPQEDGRLRLGVTDYAQSELGDIVFVELPEVGRAGATGETVAVVESVKTASDIALPVAGTIRAVNETLVDAPETINEAAESSAWLFEFEAADATRPETALDIEAYRTYVAELTS